MTPEERIAWMRITAWLRRNFTGVHFSASLRRVEDGARAAFEYVRIVNKGTIEQAEAETMRFIKARLAELQSEKPE